MAEREQTWVTHTPADRLRPFVRRYVGYRLAGFPPGVHRGLPSQHMTFIASIGRPIDVAAQTNPAQQPQRYGCVLGGLQASAALIQHDGNEEGVTIELTPLGSRMLFGMPARELWDLSLELADVVGGTGSELWERLQTTHNWTDRFRVCDDVLLRLARDVSVAPELQYSWTTLVRSHGQVSVSDLAEQTGYTRQHLTRRFREEFGLSPKLAARVVRFERARHMLHSTPSFVSLAQIAAACGYYDQSHLDRDFTELAGCTPTDLQREVLPIFQDEATPSDT